MDTGLYCVYFSTNMDLPRLAFVDLESYIGHRQILGYICKHPGPIRCDSDVAAQHTVTTIRNLKQDSIQPDAFTAESGYNFDPDSTKQL